MRRPSAGFIWLHADDVSMSSSFGPPSSLGSLVGDELGSLVGEEEGSLVGEEEGSEEGSDDPPPVEYGVQSTVNV